VKCVYGGYFQEMLTIPARGLLQDSPVAGELRRRRQQTAPTDHFLVVLRKSHDILELVVSKLRAARQTVTLFADRFSVLIYR